MQHTSFGPTPFTSVEPPISAAIDLSQGESDGYDEPAKAGSKLSSTRHGGVVYKIFLESINKKRVGTANLGVIITVKKRGDVWLNIELSDTFLYNQKGVQ